MDRLVIIIIICGLILIDIVHASKNEVCHIENDSFEICQDSHTLVSVTELYKENQGNWSQSLTVDDKELSSIAPRAFKNLKILELIIKFKNTNLNLEKESFSGLPMLESLQILSGIVELKPDLFVNIKNINYLTLKIQGNRKILLPEIPELKNLITVKYFGINFGLWKISPLFCFLPGISNLILADNNITEIRSREFSQLNQLKFLKFSNNSIHDIEPNAFVGLQNLETLEIDGEAMTEIKTNVFYKLESLKKLTIIFSKIKKIKAGAFNGLNLESLDLRNNQLSILHIDTFAGIKTKVLNLSKNPITTVEYNAFRHSSIQNFTLKNTNLTDLNVHLWGLSALTIVTVS